MYQEKEKIDKRGGREKPILRKINLAQVAVE